MSSTLTDERGETPERKIEKSLTILRGKGSNSLQQNELSSDGDYFPVPQPLKQLQKTTFPDISKNKEALLGPSLA